MNVDNREDFTVGLQAWVNQVSGPERNNRIIAKNLIIRARRPINGQIVQHLDLNNLGLSSLPDQIGQLRSLVSLDLQRNRLTTIPDSIANLTRLKSLHLRNNSFEEFPESLTNLSVLQNLYIGMNRIARIPDSIELLSQLQELDISHNRISELPQALAELSNLRVLWANSNPLRAIPESFLAPSKGLPIIHLNRGPANQDSSPPLQENLTTSESQDMEVITIFDAIINDISEEQERVELTNFLGSENLYNFKEFLPYCGRSEFFRSNPQETIQALRKIIDKMMESPQIKDQSKM